MLRTEIALPEVLKLQRLRVRVQERERASAGPPLRGEWARAAWRGAIDSLADRKRRRLVGAGPLREQGVRELTERAVGDLGPVAHLGHRRPAEPLRLEKRTTLLAGDRVTYIGYVVCTG